LLIIGNGHAPGIATGCGAIGADAGAADGCGATLLRGLAARERLLADFFFAARRDGLLRLIFRLFFPDFFLAFAILASCQLPTRRAGADTGGR